MLTEIQGQDLMSGGQRGKEPMKGARRRPLFLERQGRAKAATEIIRSPESGVGAISTEAVQFGSQGISGSSSLFLLCKMLLNKSRNLDL